MHNHTGTYKDCKWSNQTLYRLCSEMQNTNTWVSFPTVLATATAVMLLATALALILDVDVELLVLVGLPVSVLFCITVRTLCVCGWLTESSDDVINIFTPSFTPSFSPELSDDWNIFYNEVADLQNTSGYTLSKLYLQMQIMVFCNVTPSTLTSTCQYFRATFFLHLYGKTQQQRPEQYIRLHENKTNSSITMAMGWTKVYLVIFTMVI